MPTDTFDPPTRATSWPPPADDPVAPSGGHLPPPPSGRSHDAGDGGGRGRTATTLLAAAVAAAVGAGVAVPVTLAVTDAPAATTPAADAPAASPVSGEVQALGSITEIASTVSPSVAVVEVVGAEGQGSGSAVIYREDGYLVTNAHVVAGAEEVRVTLPDGTDLPAEVVGADEVSDLAVLRVDADDLPVPTWAEGLPAVGDTAVAIGSPFGLEGSVTTGIVSALGRSVSTPGAPLIDMLQTDAAINPGNSGGALVDAGGRIIGINTAILSATGANNGIGFAIPVDTVRGVADQLIETGAVEHAYLGIQGVTVDPAVAERYGIEATDGAAVVAVEPGGPADSAGLAEGDTITAIGDQPVTSMEELAGRIQGSEVGTTVPLTVVRDGETRTVDVTLAERPTDTTAEPGATPEQPNGPTLPELPGVPTP